MRHQYILVLVSIGHFFDLSFPQFVQGSEVQFRAKYAPYTLGSMESENTSKKIVTCLRLSLSNFEIAVAAIRRFL